MKRDFKIHASETNYDFIEGDENQDDDTPIGKLQGKAEPPRHRRKDDGCMLYAAMILVPTMVLILMLSLSPDKPIAQSSSGRLEKVQEDNSYKAKQGRKKHEEFLNRKKN